MKYKALTEVELLKEARQLVVKTRNKLVHRLKLGTMVQGGDEPVTSKDTRWLMPHHPFGDDEPSVSK